MHSALRSDLMSAEERLSEISEILAAGLIRLYALKSSPLSAQIGESFLDCPADQSGHPKPQSSGEQRG